MMFIFPIAAFIFHSCPSSSFHRTSAYGEKWRIDYPEEEQQKEEEYISETVEDLPV